MSAGAGGLPLWGPDEELMFQLFEVADLEQKLTTGVFGGHDRDSVVEILRVARKIADDVFAPLGPLLEEHPPQMVEGRAKLHPAAIEAVHQVRDAGFFAAAFPEDAGGLDLPFSAHSAAGAMLSAANAGLAAPSFLTAAAANLEMAYATEDQKRRFMQPMIEGRFFGTMCLSEPHAGSSLADIRTKAEPLPDGTYRITGSKMWISCGDTEGCENIVHHVLAKIPGGPPGVKGISLFIVPKFRVDADGQVGEPNAVGLAGLNHKMGYTANTNCVMAFGDGGECVGELLGEPHKGLAAMFHMMNEARIGVSFGAAALAYAGYAASLAYARERTQGRPIDNRDPSSPMIPIIEHADIRRLLLRQKAYAEGGLALCVASADLVDAQRVAKEAGDAEEAKRLHLLLEFLTPILKAWTSEKGLVANDHAIQVLGGYGYTKDYPVERLYRDNRLNPIHEGTNGIQAIDLLGRKCVMEGGAALRIFAQEVAATIEEAKASPTCAAYAAPLTEAMGRIEATLGALAPLMMKGEAGRALANATPFLEMAGQTAFAWIWLRQALAAERAAAAGRVTEDFARGKIQACRYWFAWELPQTAHLAEQLAAVEPSWAEMDEAWF
ncbi:MAG: acyl-CoA dehydrogenase [Pseudomonadota bacterium]